MPMGYFMVITRFSNQQESKSRKKTFQVQPTENIRNIPASMSLGIRTTVVSTVWIAGEFFRLRDRFLGV